MTDLAPAFIQGLALQASLIVALGAQNLFVLEQGLARHQHWRVAAVCVACDTLLIAFGVLGAAQVFASAPALKIAIGAAGVLFLAWIGVTKLREGFWDIDAGSSRAGLNRARPLAMALAYSLLNPHVYLDTVMLIGGFASQFQALSTRIQFGMGAASFSALWFLGLAGLASRMSALLGNRQARRAIALGSGAILFVLAMLMGGQVAIWSLGEGRST